MSHSHAVLTDVASGERFVVDLRPDPLMRDDVWTTADGTAMGLDEMGEQHIERVIAFLRRRALRLHMGAVARMMEWAAGPLGPRGDWSTDEFDRAFDEMCGMDPHAWIDETPIVRALKAELTRRNEPWGVEAVA